MAKQAGIIKIKGKIDDLSFYKTKRGHLVRKTNGIDKQRLLHEEAFEGQRKNMVEFGHASKAGKCVRTAFEEVLAPIYDEDMHVRLRNVLFRAIQGDKTHVRGERRLEKGNLLLLKDFEFNRYCTLGSVLHVPYKHTMDRSSGVLGVDLPSFVPKQRLRIGKKKRVTHVQLVLAAAAVNFMDYTYVGATDYSGHLACGYYGYSAYCLEM